MRINLDKIDQNQFMVHPHVVNGETLWLVQPQHIGAKWSENTLIFRSSVWNDAGELVSAGFKKFFNWSEQPEISPIPQSLKNTTIVEKIDGSLLIVSKYKGNHILRTRGTVDASKLDNGHEIEIFKRDYLPKLIEFIEVNCGVPKDTWSISYLFEWVSPENRIILNYGDTPEWYLVGAVGHADYSLSSQEMLDGLADKAGFKRPVIYNFPSVEALMADVEQWKGKEGVVIYSPVGLHKAKSLWYLALHRMKEALSSFEKVVDVWYEQGQPDYVKFQDFIVGQFDWELWSQIRGDASRICDGAKEVQQIVDGMQKYVNETLLSLGGPKDKKVRGQQARQVIASYGITNRANFVFKLLDSKPLDNEDRKKLLYQVLKK